MLSLLCSKFNIHIAFLGGVKENLLWILAGFRGKLLFQWFHIQTRLLDALYLGPRAIRTKKVEDEKK
jgi:hypothetical protein